MFYHTAENQLTHRPNLAFRIPSLSVKKEGLAVLLGTGSQATFPGMDTEGKWGMGSVLHSELRVANAANTVAFRRFSLMQCEAMIFLSQDPPSLTSQ